MSKYKGGAADVEDALGDGGVGGHGDVSLSMGAPAGLQAHD